MFYAYRVRVLVGPYTPVWILVGVSSPAVANKVKRLSKFVTPSPVTGPS